MPHSRVVEQRYRLQPSDLRGPMQVAITNVSLQGLEKIRPVLHFDKFGKRLVLDDVQSDELARITRSAVFADWVGCAVMLEPIDEEGVMRIALSAPPSQQSSPQRKPRLEQPRPSTARQTQFDQKFMSREQARILLQSLLLLVLIILITAAVYLLNNTELLWRWLDSLNASSG